MLAGLENPVHLLVILVVVLLVFGPKRLPEMGRSLGHGIRGFRDSLSGNHEEASADEPAAPPAELPTAPPERPTVPPGPPASE